MGMVTMNQVCCNTIYEVPEIKFSKKGVIDHTLPRGSLLMARNPLYERLRKLCAEPPLFGLALLLILGMAACPLFLEHHLRR
jgi:hypothetical protein